jgi:hypothetical protein
VYGAVLVVYEILIVWMPYQWEQRAHGRLNLLVKIA